LSLPGYEQGLLLLGQPASLLYTYNNLLGQPASLLYTYNNFTE